MSSIIITKQGKVSNEWHWRKQPGTDEVKQNVIGLADVLRVN
ncbi:hypothetical protein M6D81_06070 [Paenibacillus sp. J5C_2022]|nr:hypothetical protein [Paenibacillus sp. J5C2022]